jgi:hypothetical protein
LCRMGALYVEGDRTTQTMTKRDCIEAPTSSAARTTRFHLLAQRGIKRKYGFTVDALCGSPLCIREEHVVYRPWKAFTKPTKWGAYAKKLAALKVGKSFEIADFPHSESEISKLRGGIGGNREARLGGLPPRGSCWRSSVAMSVVFETCRAALRMSVCRARPEVPLPWSNDAFDPNATSASPPSL